MQCNQTSNKATEPPYIECGKRSRNFAVTRRENAMQVVNRYAVAKKANPRQKCEFFGRQCALVRPEYACKPALLDDRRINTRFIDTRESRSISSTVLGDVDAQVVYCQ